MRAKFWIAALVGFVLVLAPCVPTAYAQAPVVTLPGQVQVSQAYIDALTTWFKFYHPDDWATRLTAALSPEMSWTQEDNNHAAKQKAPVGVEVDAPAEHISFSGVPSNAWWIDLYRMELDGRWTKAFAVHPASYLPGLVPADVQIQGKLPGVYVVRACDQGGAMLHGQPSVIVVSWTRGTGGSWPQIFDLPSIPDATPEELATLKM
jgi:hypothetical protein